MHRIGIPLSTLCFVSSAFAQTDQTLPAMGGSGGGQFVARCQQGEILTGVELRTGNDVDGIRPICVVAYSATVGGPRNAYPTSFGGPGGGTVRLVCPDNAMAVAGLKVGYEGDTTRIINNVHLFCSAAATNQQLPTYPTVVFDGPQIGFEPSALFAPGYLIPLGFNQQSCPAGLVAVGINGRSGIWLDAVGLICGALRLDSSKAPVKALGRVATLSTPGPPRPICDVAREARARNSPAAPGLEAQCVASKAPVPVKALGRVATSSTPGPPLPICDAAQAARARNSPAAPGLEAQCRAAGGPPAAARFSPQDLNELADRGEAIASEDPLVAELRNQTPDGPGRRGLYVGLAAAEGDTLPGPGKQRIHDSLSSAEQGGFDVGVSFSLQRNKYADLAAIGAGIANVDPRVARARTAERDVFTWLGFDIATGWFGDPALGSRGNTSMGPGSLSIRDALSAGGQRGFNAAVAFHSSRNYTQPSGVGAAVPVANSQSDVVISQVYGGGGIANAALASDFVELLNRGTDAVSVDGWSIQYASAKGVSWQVAPLAGTILPGHYFLIQQSTGSVGTPLPTPDLVGRLMMAETAGKVALMKDNKAISGSCPTGPNIVDFVGYGGTDCSEGGVAVPELRRVTAAHRQGAGCVDTNTNAADFDVAVPQPRNQVVKPVACQP